MADPSLQAARVLLQREKAFLLLQDEHRATQRCVRFLRRQGVLTAEDAEWEQRLLARIADLEHQLDAADLELDAARAAVAEAAKQVPVAAAHNIHPQITRRSLPN